MGYKNFKLLGYQWDMNGILMGYEWDMNGI